MMKPFKAIILISLLVMCVNLVSIQAADYMNKANLSPLLDSLRFDPEYGAFTNYINPYPKPLSCIYVGSSRSINNSPAKTWLRFKVNGQIVKDIELKQENRYSAWISPNLDYVLQRSGRKLDLYNAMGEYIRSYKQVEYRFIGTGKEAVIDIIDPSLDIESTHPDSVFKDIRYEGGSYRQSENETRFSAQIMDINKQGLIIWQFRGRDQFSSESALAIQDTNSSIIYRNIYNNKAWMSHEFVSIAFSDNGKYIAALKKNNKKRIGTVIWHIAQESNLIIYNKGFEPVFTYKFRNFPQQKGYSHGFNSIKFAGDTLILAIRKNDNYTPDGKRSRKQFHFAAVDIASQKIYWSK